MRLTMLMLAVVVASSASARTWRVNVAGTGDVPTLYAAMDSASAFDVVIAEAGQYFLESALSVPEGVRLVGEAGPAQTLLYRDAYLEPATIGLGIGAGLSGVHVQGNTVALLYLQGGAGIDHCILEVPGLGSVVLGNPEYPLPEFRNCLFIDGGIALPAVFVANIILSDLWSYAVGSVLIANDVLGVVAPGIEVSSADFNFSLDPQFCGVEIGNYFLRSTSPCLPENNPYGHVELVGPLGAGCGTVSVEERTWGSIKAMYR